MLLQRNNPEDSSERPLMASVLSLGSHRRGARLPLGPDDRETTQFSETKGNLEISFKNSDFPFQLELLSFDLLVFLKSQVAQDFEIIFNTAQELFCGVLIQGATGLLAIWQNLVSYEPKEFWKTERNFWESRGQGSRILEEIAQQFVDETSCRGVFPTIRIREGTEEIRYSCS